MTEKFSVLMSVYSKESPQFLDNSIQSIWSAQKLKPSQIVLVQDGQLGKPILDVIEKWKRLIGPSFLTVELKNNVGLAKALNSGLKFCNYDLIARMDTDDIALPERFEEQVKLMTQNPEVTVSSAFIEEWDNTLSSLIGTRTLPYSHLEIIKFAKTRSPINHPCAIFRKSKIEAYGGYPEIYPEDYALWGTLLNKGEIFKNIPKVLLKMRAGDAITQRRGYKFLKGEVKIFIYFEKIGFINKLELLFNIITRSIIRLSPNYIKKILYKTLR
ncbi:glycosyltransferase [Comamonas thiooxydans]|uniref:glycosyltransferase n=1 Tax=Comamonas TaxID=283 RepID=UPI001CCD7D79|nr:glycosyltransferase [Comamonas thiooxydans]UBQ41362.1 glycosyltransferase [Comamonas thiooxydans]